jgi:hypothetical protein
MELRVMDANGDHDRPVTTIAGREYSPAWCPVPTVVHTLVGLTGSDGGSNPPFGTQKPLVVVGLTDEGLAGAATVGTGASRWSSIRVAALRDLGSRLAGCKITASKLKNVQEDMGRGNPPRVWDFSGAPNVGAVLVFFSAATGRVSSVIPSSDTALTATQAAFAQERDGQIVVRGDFPAVYSGDRPDINLASQPVAEVILNAETGTVVSMRKAGACPG